ncbi:MAG: hypothetical protein ABSE86_13755 [Bryobacteraceae bacterium]
MAASAVTLRVALAAVPGEASFDVIVLVVTTIAPLALEAACTVTGTLQDSPAVRVTFETLMLLSPKLLLPPHMLVKLLPRVILDGKVTLTATPVSAVALGLEMVSWYVEVSAPPARTVEGVKLALTAAGTCADACPMQIVTRASGNQTAGCLKRIIGNLPEAFTLKEGIFRYL